MLPSNEDHQCPISVLMIQIPKRMLLKSIELRAECEGCGKLSLEVMLSADCAYYAKEMTYIVYYISSANPPGQRGITPIFANDQSPQGLDLTRMIM